MPASQPKSRNAPHDKRRLRARVIEEVGYRRAPRELRRLDDRDLDDLDLGRGDLPGLARRHAREVAGRAQHRVARRKP
jgi:uncharacterized protein YjiS (DUF1127 family)